MSVAIFLATCSLGTSSDSTGRGAGVFGGAFVLTLVAPVLVVFGSVHAGDPSGGPLMSARRVRQLRFQTPLWGLCTRGESFERVGGVSLGGIG